MALTPAERKAAQRARDSEKGLVQVNVKVHESRAEEIRKIAAAMLKPKRKS